MISALSPCRLVPQSPCHVIFFSVPASPRPRVSPSPRLRVRPTPPAPSPRPSSSVYSVISGNHDRDARLGLRLSSPLYSYQRPFHGTFMPASMIAKALSLSQTDETRRVNAQHDRTRGRQHPEDHHYDAVSLLAYRISFQISIAAVPDHCFCLRELSGVYSPLQVRQLHRGTIGCGKRSCRSYSL